MANIKRLEQAREIFAGIPEDRVDLGNWVQECGTIACGIGHLLLAKIDPDVLGTEHDPEDCHSILVQTVHLDAPITPYIWGASWFGLDHSQFWRLFGAASSSELNTPDSDSAMSHKNILLNRLDAFLVKARK